MERKEALQKAIDYLKSTGGDNWEHKDELKRKTQSMGFMSTAHAIADIYQRGQNPKDMDLQKIDFSLSQPEVRKQIDELLTKSGADRFQNKKDAKMKSQIEKAEEIHEKNKEILKEAQEKASKQIDELTPNSEEYQKIQGARSQAWQGYMAGVNNANSGLKSIKRSIEYANAILEMDEKLEEDFKGDFRNLKRLKEQMQELVNEIDSTNFEAQLDQSVIKEQETEDKEKLTEENLKSIIEEYGNDKNAVDQVFLMDEAVEQYDATEEEIEDLMERMKVEGTLFEPSRGSIALI